VELILERGLEVAAQLIALNGGVRDLIGLHLVKEVGVWDLYILAATRAFLEDTPEKDEAYDNDDPEHNGFNRRIHQDSSFSVSGEPLTVVASPTAPRVRRHSSL
jgi:hypothetical protein